MSELKFVDTKTVGKGIYLFHPDKVNTFLLHIYRNKFHKSYH